MNDDLGRGYDDHVKRSMRTAPDGRLVWALPIVVLVVAVVVANLR